jgi:L-ribulose-5-phosphate 4-epimerase
VTLDALRDEVAAANRAIDRAGLVTLSFGNASGVDRDAGVLLIKPSGLRCADVRPEDLVAVRLDDDDVVDGTVRASSDTPTHRHLYLAFPSIGGVVHTHSTSAAAWAQAARPIPAFGTTHADYFRGPVLVSRPMHAAEVGGDYEWETGRVIAETLREHDRTPEDAPAVLVRSHGPFAWGATPTAAVEAAVALEEIATIAWRTVGIDASAPAISAELLHRHFDRKHGPTAYYGQPAAEEAGGRRR